MRRAAIARSFTVEHNVKKGYYIYLRKNEGNCFSPSSPGGPEFQSVHNPCLLPLLVPSLAAFAHGPISLEYHGLMQFITLESDFRYF